MGRFSQQTAALYKDLNVKQKLKILRMRTMILKVSSGKCDTCLFITGVVNSRCEIPIGGDRYLVRVERCVRIWREPLSACEAMIMKVIWDQKGDISVPELIDLIQERYKRDYKRTTVVTFLTRLNGKGFISSRRAGRISYIHAEKSEEEYKAKLSAREVNFWFDGKPAEFIAALSNNQSLSKEDIKQIRGLLDEMDQ